jgi:uncharacterized membrane protein
MVGAFIALLVLLQIGVLRYAYKRVGISSGAALVVLFGSLLGSYFNIPVAYLPEQHVFARQEIDFFGMRYIGGSLGTLIGADLLNLGSIRGLGAPIASIGGAGTLDGVFLIGIVAVLIASLSEWWSRR